MKLGDLVRYLPKEYGTADRPIKDQWVGLVGMVVDIFRRDERGNPKELSVLVVHPDDGHHSEVFTFEGDVELVGELTEEQLDIVIGGQSRESFENWRAEEVNKHNFDRLGRED